MLKIAFSTVAIAAVTVSPGIIAAANAATFATDFSVSIDSGVFLVGETFGGQLTYEDSLLSGTGTELLDPNTGLLSLSFDYVGADLSTPVTYTETDDDISSGFPLAIFEDGQLTGLDYSVSITPDLTFQFREEPLGSGDFGFFTDNFSTFEFNTGTIAFGDPVPVPVPEPSILAGLVILAGLAIRR